VLVRDHTNADATNVCHLKQGDYFGEVSLLKDTVASATVKSSNYSTLVRIGKDVFFEMIA
jgi:CRP-like cAMP-binding protein